MIINVYINKLITEQMEIIGIYIYIYIYIYSTPSIISIPTKERVFLSVDLYAIIQYSVAVVNFSNSLLLFCFSSILLISSYTLTLFSFSFNNWIWIHVCIPTWLCMSVNQPLTRVLFRKKYLLCAIRSHGRTFTNNCLSRRVSTK